MKESLKFKLESLTDRQEELHALLADPEVKEWLEQMDAMALVPKKRST